MDTPAETGTDLPGVSSDHLEDTRWIEIRRRQRALRTKTTADPQGSPSTITLRSNRLRAAPPPTPLPPADIKIVFRPRGGLDLTSHDPLTLATHLQTQAFLPPHPQDQIRLHLRANFAVISTPLEDRARQYAALSSLRIGNQQYPLATHVAAPANSIAGVVSGLPLDKNINDVLTDLVNFNPHLHILDARRMGSSTLTQVTFNGSRVPYWIRYHMVTLRCTPLKRKTEACPRCWTVGHRADVCPSPAVDKRCTTCGTVNPSPQHLCHPCCIICSGPHPTGDPACPRRYRRPLATRRRNVPARDTPAFSAPRDSPPSTTTVHLTDRPPPVDSGSRTQSSTARPATKSHPYSSHGRPAAQDFASPTYAQVSARGQTPLLPPPLNSPSPRPHSLNNTHLRRQ